MDDENLLWGGRTISLAALIPMALCIPIVFYNGMVAWGVIRRQHVPSAIPVVGSILAAVAFGMAALAPANPYKAAILVLASVVWFVIAAVDCVVLFRK